MGMLSKFTRSKRSKKFDYAPRYYDDKGKGNPFKIEPKLDQFRSTLNPARGLKGKFGSAMSDVQRQGDTNIKVRMAIIIAILVLIVLYIIDFDISIFFPN